jgi:shikimate dehydrogenase
MGHPVAHSRSPMLHGHWLETLGIPGRYERQDVAPARFPAFLRGLAQQGYLGGNITVPHKEAAFRAVDLRDAAAEAVGAVNTVWYESGKLIGSNTDGLGFMAHLDACAPDWDTHDGRAIVLGAGGSARSIVHALLGRGVAIAVVNRTLGRAEELARHYGRAVTAHSFAELPALLSRACLLVNTTSLGMTGQPPLAIEIGHLDAQAVVYDIVYVPLETPLLAAAKARGHRVADGLGMLLHQAVPGFARWFGVTPRVTPQLRALLESDIRAKESPSKAGAS